MRRRPSPLSPHDALEGCGGEDTAAEIEDDFGKRVRHLGGKEAHLPRTAEGYGCQFPLAGRLHRLRSLLREDRADPKGMWDRFRGEEGDSLGPVEAYWSFATEGDLIDELIEGARSGRARSFAGFPYAPRSSTAPSQKPDQWRAGWRGRVRALFWRIPRSPDRGGLPMASGVRAGHSLS